MSKCSVFNTLKSKCSHWTLFLPKYWACAEPATKRKRRDERRSLRTFTHLVGMSCPNARDAGCKFVAAPVTAGIVLLSSVARVLQTAAAAGYTAAAGGRGVARRG